MDDVVELKHVTKKFGAKTAVADLSLGIPKGTIFALLGPNGAGKTTTIKMMMNILKPTHGSIKVLGTDSKRLDIKDFQKIGYVSENQEILEWMTVRQFLNYCRKMYPTWDEEFCKTLITQFNLPLDETLKKTSRGNKMKAALVSSLAYRPELLVLDEPFSGLDPVVRQEFINGIFKLTESEHWSVIISSHDMEEVERIADMIGFIDQSKLRLVELTESLQKRFRKIAVVLQTAPLLSKDRPHSWLSIQHKERAIEIVESRYEHGKTEENIQKAFGPYTSVIAVPMSLKEIYIILATTFKYADRG